MPRMIRLVFLVEAFIFGESDWVWGEQLSGKVVSVINGDTFGVMCERGKVLVRLDGIDCPKTFAGDPAVQYAIIQVLQKYVTIVMSASETTKLQKGWVVLGDLVLADGSSLSQKLLHEGLAEMGKDPARARYTELQAEVQKVRIRQAEEARLAEEAKRTKEAEARRAEEAERKKKEEEARQEAAEAEEYRRQQVAKGLVERDGQWVDPAEELARKKSLMNVPYRVSQVLPDGLLCVRGKREGSLGLMYTGDTFYLYGTPGPFVVDDEKRVGDLYYAGTYSYVTVLHSQKTIASYASDLSTAARILKIKLSSK